ncbi:MAG: hypothetical protein U5K29_08480 [Acidimicrobiales bacterium]|nr:hypothetical protein [Acidimicrobiales bacterium]
MNPAYVPALIAGGFALLVALLSPAFTAAAERRLRKREVLAKAVGALASYREYPYVIRRRDESNPEAERRRISTEVMAIQRELTEASIWIGAEAPKLYDGYRTAVEDHRRIAGRLMNEAWGQPAMSDDAGMNIADLHDELAPLRDHDAFLAELIRDEVTFRWNPFR